MGWDIANFIVERIVEIVYDVGADVSPSCFGVMKRAQKKTNLLGPRREKNGNAAPWSVTVDEGVEPARSCPSPTGSQPSRRIAALGHSHEKVPVWNHTQDAFLAQFVYECTTDTFANICSRNRREQEQKRTR